MVGLGFDFSREIVDDFRPPIELPVGEEGKEGLASSIRRRESKNVGGLCSMSVKLTSHVPFT